MTLMLFVVSVWGDAPHQWIADRAIHSLPPAEREFFETLKPVLLRKVLEPDEIKREDKLEDYDHYFHLDLVTEPPPDESLLKAKIRNYPRSQGRLPYAVREEFEALVAAIRARDPDQIAHHAGYLLHYLSDATQPLHATQRYDCKAGGCDRSHRLHLTVDVDCFKLLARELEGYRAESLRELGDPFTEAVEILRASAQHVDTIWSVHRQDHRAGVVTRSPEVQAAVRARLAAAVEACARYLHAAYVRGTAMDALPRPRDVARPPPPAHEHEHRPEPLRPPAPEPRPPVPGPDPLPVIGGVALFILIVVAVVLVSGRRR